MHYGKDERRYIRHSDNYGQPQQTDIAERYLYKAGHDGKQNEEQRKTDRGF
jgi:hypothetical protein